MNSQFNPVKTGSLDAAACAALANRAQNQHTAPAERRREIPEVVDRLFNQAELLEVHTERLSMRLGVVLTPSNPRQDVTGPAAPPTATALGEHFATLICRFANVIESLESLESRLEL